jgi:hypothetical protein
MPNNKPTVLAVNPGTKYLALAVFIGPELRQWQIKVFKGKWSKAKLRKIMRAIAGVIGRFGADDLALKRLHPFRSSRHLNELVFELQNTAWERGLSVQDYSIKELERCFSAGDKLTKAKMAETVVAEYPALFNEWEKERNHKNPYYIRLFEAVALGAVCLKSQDRSEPINNN